MRIVFMGTPRFACPSLRALKDAGHEVVQVVTRQDKPTGRGKKIKAPPVKETAQELRLPVFQPQRVNSPETLAALKDLDPDVLVVVAFGAILKKSLLDLAPHGSVNVHASLLPAYRGVAPAPWALIHGERITGVTTMHMDTGVDTGPILKQLPMEVSPHETAGDLLERMAQNGADLLVETLAGLEAGSITPRPQSEAGASYAPFLEKAHGYLDLRGSAQDVFNQFRGVTPAPGARVFWNGDPVLVKQLRAIQNVSGEPYSVIEVGGRHVRLACKHGAVDLLTVRPPGKGDMDASAWARGRGIEVGTRLAQPPEFPDLSLRTAVTS